jgi:type IV pilus assembly protein PilM
VARNDPVVGISLTEHAARAVAMDPSTLRPVAASETLRTGILADSLRAALRPLRVRPKAVAAGIGLDRATVRRMQLPQTSAQNLDRLVRFEAERYIPLPMEAVELDYEARQDRGADRTDVVVAAVRKEDAAQLDRALAEATGASTMLDTAGTALLAAWEGVRGDEAGAALLVDLSGASASMVVCESSSLVLARSVATGADALREAIAQDLHISLPEAEQVRCSQGVTGLEAGPPDLTASEEPSDRERTSAWLNTLAQELRRTLESFRGQRGGVAACAVALTGEGADTPGLVEALERATGTAVDVFDPLSGGQLALPSPGHNFTVAYGLALRAAGKSPVTVDLSPRAQRAGRRRRQKLTGWFGVAAVVGLSLVAAYVYASFHLDRAEEQLQQVEEDVDALTADVGDLESAVADAAAVTEVEGLLESLDRTEARPLDILLDVSLSLAGGVWLTDFSYDQEQGIALRGNALDAGSITETVRALSRKPYLAKVELSGIAFVEIGDREVYEFEIAGDFEKPEEDES